MPKAIHQRFRLVKTLMRTDCASTVFMTGPFLKVAARNCVV